MKAMMVDTEYSVRNQLHTESSVEDENSKNHIEDNEYKFHVLEATSPATDSNGQGADLVSSDTEEGKPAEKQQHETGPKDTSMLSSSSASSGSISPAPGHKPNPLHAQHAASKPLPGLQIAAEWYKQYEDRLLSQRNALFAGRDG